MTYPMEPLNSTLVLEAVRDPRLRGYLVDKSVPFDAVDLPLVDYLPKVPKDRAEVNLVVGSGVTRMLYRASIGVWTQIGAAPLVTTLPTPATGAVDGISVAIVADDTSGVEWVFRYDSTETTYKWHFVGGPPLYAEVQTSETTTSSTFVALTTAGPTVTLPLAGDYTVSLGAQTSNNTAGALGHMSYDIGGTGAVDADGPRHTSGLSGSDTAIAYTRRKTGLTSVALTAKYKQIAGGTATFHRRWLSATPVRVI